MTKTNFILKFLKNISKLINSLLEKNLNKLKFNNLINLTKSNRIVFTFVAVIILFISYLSLPTFFKQSEISKKLEQELIKQFNLNFNLGGNLTYSFFPRPHFIINEAIIINNEYEISEIKKLKTYVTLDNLFSLEKIEVINLIIEDANFYLNKKNNNFFVKLLKNDFKDKKIKIKNSNVFFKSINDEILFINKILDMKYYYDSKDHKNILNSNNKIFNIPYQIKLYDNKEENKFISKLKLKFLKFQIENEHDYSKELKTGTVSMILNKNKSIANYKTDKNFFEFNLFDKIENQKFFYNGMFNLNPFYSFLNGKSERLNLSYFFNSNSIISQFLKTEIFFNKNLEFKLNIKADTLYNNLNLINFDINSKIQEGLIDIDNTKFEWKNFAKFSLSDSLIFIKDGELILDGKLEININNYKEIYKYLLTPKNYRKKFEIINLGFTYNFDQKFTKLSDIRIDKKYNQNLNKIMSNIILKDNNLQNKIYLKKLLNEAIKSQSG